MLTFCGKTANEVWEKIIQHIDEQPDKKASSSRYAPVIWENLNTVIKIEDPTRNIISSPLRKLSMRYAIGELLWYLSGSQKLNGIQQFSDFWSSLSEDGVTVSSAYGHKIFTVKDSKGKTQWDNLVKELQFNPESRRAVLMIHNIFEYNDKDHPCTLSIQFQIRENKLYATTTMRSNDLWRGFPYDVFFFTSIQIMLAMKLNIEVGEYTHFVGNLHLYKEDYGKYKNNSSLLKG